VRDKSSAPIDHPVTAGLTWLRPARSFEIWTATYAPGTAPDPKKIIALHDMGLLNGMDRWDDTRVLVADSVPGSIYLVDIAKATSTVPITDPLVGMPENPILPIAANGVRASADKKHVYFTNTARLLLGRVAVNADARPTAPAEAIAQGIGFDDFAIGRDGKSVFVTTHAQNTVVRVDVGAAVNGAAQPVVVAGAPDKLDLPGSTACAFGRGEKDQSTLYVVTTGGLSVPVNGQVEPAKVAAVEIA
jgi:sugar lactone lactonase YvrE